MTLRIGKVEATFLSLLAAYVLLSFLQAPFTLQILVAASLLVTGAWAFIRVARKVVRKLLWRLRNRLIVAYIFIALVPVVLITLLAGIASFLLGGQFTVWLITSELERRTAALRTGIISEEQYPGLTLTDAPAGWQPGSGLAVMDGMLYGWAVDVRRGKRLLSSFPITREYLGELAPDMAETAILDLKSDRSLLHPGNNGEAPSHNRFPPAVNRFDFEIRWGVPLPVHRWDQPSEVLNEWLTVRTRPSAVVRTLFRQKVDWANDFAPMLLLTFSIAFLLAELIALFIGISITRTITAAVHDLYERTQRIRAGDFSHRIPVTGNDQLAELSQSFNEMTANLQRLLEIEKERERLQAELEIAREVQNQLYPKKLPTVESLAMIAVCNPARMVSGDYYDYQQLGPDKVALAIGDVAGKGISAALLMATVQSSFRSQIRGTMEMSVAAPDGRTHLQISTSTMVSQLNQQLYADTSPEKYATFFLGIFDERRGSLTYTNAGHLPPLLVRDGEASRLEVNGMVVGALPFARYGESHMELQPGDIVVFFTDGITEPENAYGEMFGEERLSEIVIKNAHRSEREIIDCVMDAVAQWTGAGELQDDMTILVMRRK